MAVFHYVGWGTMRPKAWVQQLDRSDKAIDEALAAMERSVEKFREDMRLERAKIAEKQALC